MELIYKKLIDITLEIHYIKFIKTETNLTRKGNQMEYGVVLSIESEPYATDLETITCRSLEAAKYFARQFMEGNIHTSLTNRRYYCIYSYNKYTKEFKELHANYVFELTRPEVTDFMV